jgi:UDP-N-acetyl-2-amino-2-deoxyglucuronate dehydrogenase
LKTYSLGLIGAGNISDTHARAATAIPQVKVAAVYARDREKADRLAARHGAAGYDSLDRFLEHRPMDMVAIGTPSGLHAAQGIEAARRGLHVLVEKPIDISTSRADLLIAAARDNRVKLGVFLQDRFSQGARQLKALVDQGQIGAPILASARVKWFRSAEYYANSTWRGTWAFDGGGALMNQGVHTVDLIMWLLGPVARLSAKTTTSPLHAIEVEDTAVALLEFASGALGTLEAATSVFPGYPRRIEITGTEGTVVFEDDRITAIDLRGRSDLTPPDTPARPNERSSSPVVADARGHQAVIEDFIQAIERDTKPGCDGQEARRSVAVVEAIYASSRAGSSVVVS